MKFTGKPNGKLTAVALACIMGICLLIGGSYAAYTRQAYQRGVVRNNDTDIVRFTSDYLQLCTSGTQDTSYAVRNITYGEKEKEEETVSFDIHIYNYANGNMNLVSKQDITYTMQIRFSDGAGPYTVKCDSDTVQKVSTGEIYTKTVTLNGREARENTYTITLPGADIDKVNITATAIPDNTAITNNQILAAILTPGTSISTGTFRAVGEFLDQTGTPKEYDGFNYEVSISGGRATATLTWKKDTVEIDKFFLEKTGKSDDEIKTALESGTVTFDMDQAAGTGDYLIPFYIKNESGIPNTWPEMKNMVTFTATQQSN